MGEGGIETNEELTNSALKMDPEEGGEVVAKEFAVGEMEESIRSIAVNVEGGTDKFAELRVKGACVFKMRLAAERIEAGDGAEKSGAEGGKGNRMGGGQGGAQRMKAMGSLGECFCLCSFEGSIHSNCGAKRAMREDRSVKERGEGKADNGEGGGVNCAEKKTPGCAGEGGEGGIGGAVVKSNGAFLGIASNMGDNGEGADGIDVVLDARGECFDVFGTEKAGPIITVGCKG